MRLIIGRGMCRISGPLNPTGCFAVTTFYHTETVKLGTGNLNVFKELALNTPFSQQTVFILSFTPVTNVKNVFMTKACYILSRS